MPLYHNTFRAMNCVMTAWVYSEETSALAALDAVADWMHEVEARLSRFRPKSELSQLNAQAGEPFQASPILWEVTQQALEAAARTNGIFDPTIGQALIAAGYDRSFEKLPAKREQAPEIVQPTPGAWQDIQLDPDQHTITLPPGVRLDLGGIAKGWAADQALALLAPYGPAMVDAGGDLAIGQAPPDEQGWAVGIADPLSPDDDIVNLSVAEAGLATSGTDFRRWQYNGRTQHHLIDPTQAMPAATDILTSTVIAPTAMEADVLALVLTVLGQPDVSRWLQTQPQTPALIVLTDGRTYQTESFKNYVNSYYPIYQDR